MNFGMIKYNLWLAKLNLGWLISRINNEFNLRAFKFYMTEIIFCIHEAFSVARDPYYLSRGEWDNYAVLEPKETGLDVYVFIPVGYHLSKPYIRISTWYQYMSTYDDFDNLLGKDPTIAITLDGKIHIGKDYQDETALITTEEKFVYNGDFESVKMFVKNNIHIIQILNNKHIEGRHWEYYLTDDEIKTIKRMTI